MWCLKPGTKAGFSRRYFDSAPIHSLPGRQLGPSMWPTCERRCAHSTSPCIHLYVLQLVGLKWCHHTSCCMAGAKQPYSSLNFYLKHKFVPQVSKRPIQSLNLNFSFGLILCLPQQLTPSAQLYWETKKVIEDLASINHSLTRLYLHSAGQWDDMYTDRQRLQKEICKRMHGREENGSDWS